MDITRNRDNDNNTFRGFNSYFGDRNRNSNLNDRFRNVSPNYHRNSVSENRYQVDNPYTQFLQHQYYVPSYGNLSNLYRRHDQRRQNNTNRSNTSNLYDYILRNVDLSPVIVYPSQEQIEHATERIYFDASNIQQLTDPIDLNPFERNEQLIRILHCGHCFREENIMEWFRTNVRCPLCRFDIRDTILNEHDNNHNNVNGNGNTNNDRTRQRERYRTRIREVIENTGRSENTNNNDQLSTNPVYTLNTTLPIDYLTLLENSNDALETYLSFIDNDTSSNSI